jgi:hypothetical protein
MVAAGTSRPVRTAPATAGMPPGGHDSPEMRFQRIGTKVACMLRIFGKKRQILALLAEISRQTPRNGLPGLKEG